MYKDISSRQIEIIEASGKVIMAKGIAGLTTKNLANEMNFSESALYRHFKNKEAIIIHLIGYLASNITDRFNDIISSDLKPEEQYLALFKSQFAFFKANPHFIVIVLSDGFIDNTAEVKNEILKLINSNAALIGKVIKSGQKSKVFNDKFEVEDLLHFTMGSFRLQMLKWKLEGFSFDIEKQGIKTMTKLLTLISK